jgi:hypothetical protein
VLLSSRSPGHSGVYARLRELCPAMTLKLFGSCSSAHRLDGIDTRLHGRLGSIEELGTGGVVYNNCKMPKPSRAQTRNKAGHRVARHREEST